MTRKPRSEAAITTIHAKRTAIIVDTTGQRSAAAQSTTTSHGGVCHMNSMRKAAQPNAKSDALRIPAVQTGL